VSEEIVSDETTNKTVLVVDDSELSRAVIARLLGKQGWTVLTAHDGAEGAVVALRELPDVVVTDLEMPVMDGYQLARLLKSDPATRHLSLLILTSHGEASSRFWGLETGADAYLVKDDLEGELVAAVERLLASPRPPEAAAAAAPRTPLDVLARVSRHLDSRLLEAVLVNRILERGMQAETLQDAGDAILATVADIVDSWLLGLAVLEGDSISIVIELGSETARATAAAIACRLEAELGPEPTARRQLRVEGGREGDGRPVDADALLLIRLPLRSAQAVLAIAPKDVDYHGSREHVLLGRVSQQLALVLDNARLAQRLRELSMRDDLTRLLNRRTIRQRLHEEVQRARRYGHQLSIALCDLDHFKQVNDTFGHQAGDRVLVAIAEVLRREARAPDVAGRYGGEEFLILLPETGLASARQAARRLRHTIETSRTVLPDGQVLPLTASLGVAALSEIESDVEAALDELLALADQRLYAAKAAGRNRVIP
jgi:two-component system cell cycle response regulator